MKTRALFLVPLLALLACAKTNAPIEVVAICLPPDDAEACEFADTCDAQSIGLSAMDTSVTDVLWLIIEVHNQTLNNANGDIGRVNTQDAFVHEARVTFDGAAVSESRFPILGSAHVPADGSAVISVLGIDEAVGAEFISLLPAFGDKVDVVGHMRLRGVYADTTTFETGDFDVPIRVCNGCIGAFLSVPCPTLGDFRSICPRNDGQMPLSTSCSAP
jgi:hypothetical protein